jgi:PT repeat
MSNQMESGNGFANWLEQELERRVASQIGPNALPSQSVYHAAFLHGGTALSIFSHVSSAVSAKAAGGLAAAALVVGGGAAATVATGSANPVIWGQAVVATVNTCKSDLTSGKHGIGTCVSTFAKQKGQQERAAHASSARDNQPTSHPTGAPTSHPTGAPTSHPTGAPSAHPTGKP